MAALKRAENFESEELWQRALAECLVRGACLTSTMVTLEPTP